MNFPNNIITCMKFNVEKVIISVLIYTTKNVCIQLVVRGNYCKENENIIAVDRFKIPFI